MARRTDLPEFFAEALEGASDEELAAALESLAFMTAAIGREPPSAEARQRLLSAVEAEPHAPFVEKLSALFDLGVERIREILTAIGDAASWEPGPMPGIELMHFAGGPRVASADNGIVRMAPGLPFPKHKHLGVERILILEGEYVDDSGRRWGPGELHVSDASMEHAYTVGERGVTYALSLEGDIWIEGMPGPLRG